MRPVIWLAIAFLREHPVRATLTSLASIASTCVVVWVVSGYDALLLTFDEYAHKALGHYALCVAPINAADEAVPVQAIEVLRASPAVSSVTTMWAQPIEVKAINPLSGEDRPQSSSLYKTNALHDLDGPHPHVIDGRGDSTSLFNPNILMLLGIDAVEPPFEVKQGRWLNSTSDDSFEAVLALDVAKRLGVSVGSALYVGKGELVQVIQIVGLIDTPLAGPNGRRLTYTLLSPSVGELYVSLPLAARLHGEPPRRHFIGVSVKPEADINQLRFGLAPRLAQLRPPVQFQEAHDIEERLDETASAENVRLQAWATTGVAMLVALLVILGTLSMGASERARQLALLRAVAFTRRQIGLLVAAEGALLATIGFVGGLLLAQGLLWLTAQSAPRLLRYGAVVGLNSALLAAIAAYGGAALASLLPIYRATRVRPIEAMASAGARLTPPKAARPLTFGVGLLLIALNPLLTFVIPPDFGPQLMAHILIGFIAMAAGFVLIAPGVVTLVDRLISPLLARLLGLHPSLLASPLTQHLWRTVGAALSMSVGLALFIAVQVWGLTMLDAFIPGPWAPDALIAFTPKGLPFDKAVEVCQLPGVDPDRCLPIVAEQARFTRDLTGSAQRASIVRQDNLVIVGLDADKGVGGDDPLFAFDWVKGSPEAAVKQMKAGRGVVVPEHLLREAKLDIGDDFELVPPARPDHPVRYTIVGAVRLVGWHWQTKHTGLRPRSHRAAALIFAHAPFVAEDFGFEAATHVWLSYQPGGAHKDTLATGTQALYAKHLGQDVQIRDKLMGPPPDEALPAVKVMPVEEIRQATRGAAGKWIWMISQIPLIALLIAGLGVLNVILASVRARRWSMGVLRAIGFTRATLVRIVLAEGILIGVVASLLSLGFGIIAGWCGAGFAEYISFFGGMRPALVIPALPVLSGLFAALLLATFAAAWPAISIGRAHPLSLLRQGRGPF